MNNQLLLLEFAKTTSAKKIYVHGLENEVKEMIKSLGQTKITSMLLNEKYSKVKEWSIGRKPIALKSLHQLMLLCPKQIQEEVKELFLKNEVRLSCRYSQHTIKLPKLINPDIAYIIGLILGDGHLPKIRYDKKMVWYVGVYFDNKEHQLIYDKLIEKEFGLIPKHYQSKPNCFESSINSKVVHWLFTNYFKIHNGKKCNKIFLSDNILQCQENALAAIQGLFDSDGTITKNGTIQYATTSKTMIQQVSNLLEQHGIYASIYVWIKDKKYLPLYSLRIKSKNRTIFEKKICFRHPLKRVLLKKFCNSPVV